MGPIERTFHNWWVKRSKCCYFFVYLFSWHKWKKYWLILLFLKIFFAHLSQCFSLHVSTQSEFSVLLITCILVLRDHSNLRLEPCILHVVSIRSAHALGVLFKTKLFKSGLLSVHVSMPNSRVHVLFLFLA